jgi:hypothetical protein
MSVDEHLNSIHLKYVALVEPWGDLPMTEYLVTAALWDNSGKYVIALLDREGRSASSWRSCWFDTEEEVTDFIGRLQITEYQKSLDKALGKK